MKLPIHFERSREQLASTFLNRFASVKRAVLLAVLDLLLLPVVGRAQIWEDDIASIRQKHILKITRVGPHPEDSAANYYELLPQGGIARIAIWDGDTSYYVYDSLNREVAKRSGREHSYTIYSYDSLNRVSRDIRTSIGVHRSRLTGLVLDTSVYVHSRHYDTLGRLVQDSTSEVIELLDPERGTAHSLSFAQGRPSFEMWRHYDRLGRDSDNFSIDPTVLDDTIACSWHRTYFHDLLRHTMRWSESVKDRRGRVLAVETNVEDSTTGISIDSLNLQGSVEVWYDTVRANGTYQSGSNGEITYRRYMTPDKTRYIIETYVKGRLTAKHEYLYEYDLK